MKFYFYLYPLFSRTPWKLLWKCLASHLVSTSCKLTPFQIQPESALNSLYQKQPSRGILRKMCFQKMYAANFMYRRAPMWKCNLLNSHFDMGVLLYICCIFSENFSLRTHLDGCVYCIPSLPDKSFIFCESELNLIQNRWCLQKTYFSSFVFFTLSLNLL